MLALQHGVFSRQDEDNRAECKLICLFIYFSTTSYMRYNIIKTVTEKQQKSYAVTK